MEKSNLEAKCNNFSENFSKFKRKTQNFEKKLKKAWISGQTFMELHAWYWLPIMNSLLQSVKNASQLTLRVTEGPFMFVSVYYTYMKACLNFQFPFLGNHGTKNMWKCFRQAEKFNGNFLIITTSSHVSVKASLLYI